jgi:DNA-binding IclR family transcriptional regulator
MERTSFIPYLEAKQKRERAERNAPRVTGGTAFSVLVALASDPEGVMSLGDLQQASGMSIFEFTESLKRLMASGYLNIDGEPGSETARLTKLGSEVADLARPA